MQLRLGRTFHESRTGRRAVGTELFRFSKLHAEPRGRRFGRRGSQALDPRHGEREGGLGPALYKEWRLTAPAAGTGIFAPGVGRGQLVTLILQGHGNSCASAADFTHWTLVVSGPAAEYHLFGHLVQP